MTEVRPGYKQTEVGVIPDEWEVEPLGSVMVFQNGFNTDKAAYGRGTPFINVLEVITRTHLTPAHIPGRVVVDAKQLAAFEVRQGDLLFNRTSETQAEVALAAVYSADEPVVFGGFVIRGRPSPTRLLGTYGGYGLRSPVMRAQLVARGQGAVRANVGQRDLRKVLTPLPPLPEQQAIAEALGDADSLIEALEGLIAKKRVIKQGAMQDLLTGQRRLPGFQGEWRTAPIGDLFDFGRTVPLSRAQLSQEGDVKYVHYGDIHTRLHNHLDFQRTPTPGADRLLCGSASALKIGDWVFADASEDYDGVAKAVEISRLPTDKGAVAGLHTFVLRERGRTFAPGFKGYLANASTFRAQVMRAATGMKVFGISKSQMKNVELSFPSALDEQSAIAAVLSDMDAEIAALKEKLAKARAVKQGMMQVLLTGEIRLT